MKTLNIKSLILGAIVATSIIILTGSKSDNPDNIKFVAMPAGFGIYNQETKTLHYYTFMLGTLRKTPTASFKVSDDGASLTEIK